MKGLFWFRGNKIKRLHLSTEIHCDSPAWKCNCKSYVNRGLREGGLTACSENFKMPFFKIYWKILSKGYPNGSRTSPIFFFLKYLNKYGCYWHPKFQQLWTVAGRLIEQRPKFFCQICIVILCTNVENFKKISWFMFKLEPND